MIVQNSAVQSGHCLSFLCCDVNCEMKKTTCPLPRLKLILNSMKNVYVPMKQQSIISATRRLEYFELFFQEFCYETHRLIQKRWESAKNFFFEKPNKTISFFGSGFQITLLKHTGEVFFCSA